MSIPTTITAVPIPKTFFTNRLTSDPPLTFALPGSCWRLYIGVRPPCGNLWGSLRESYWIRALSDRSPRCSAARARPSRTEPGRNSSPQPRFAPRHALGHLSRNAGHPNAIGRVVRKVRHELPDRNAKDDRMSVSYTHLTLPTKRIV